MIVRRRAVAVAAAIATLLTLTPAASAVELAQEVAPELARGLVQEALAPPPSVGPPAPPPAWPEAPSGMTACCFILVDQRTGQVLAANQPDERRPVASTVKTLTALTVLRRRELTDTVTVGQEIVGVGGASVGLKPGDVWTVEDLLEGLIARSGNDVAVALAVAVGGSVDGFLQLMRDDAAQLGLEGIVVETPNGLDDSNRISARDLAAISRAALDDAEFAAIAGRPTVVLPGVGEVETRNDLLFDYEGATGVKTGFTDLAGRCLIASATRDGRSLVAVVMQSEDEDDHFVEAGRLLDHGFSSFATTNVTDPGVAMRVRSAGRWHDLRTDRDLDLLAPAGGEPLQVRVPLGAAPPPDGDVLDVTVTFGETTLATAPLVVDAEPPLEVDGVAALGSSLYDRAYEAMRLATATGAWPSDG